MRALHDAGDPTPNFTSGQRVVCSICALLHATLFLHCAACVYIGILRDEVSSFTVYSLLRPTHAAWTAAYSFDLVAIAGFGVIPFSRVPPSSNGRDIFFHHLPLLFIQALFLPLVRGWHSTEPMVGQVSQNPEIAALVLQIVGWSGISSLNEMVMCMQRVDAPRGVWNTRTMYLFEMSYKACIFTVNGTCSLVASMRVMALNYVGLFSSPFCYALLVGCFFVVAMYPGMARRSLLKLHAVLMGGVDGTPPGAPALVQLLDLKAA